MGLLTTDHNCQNTVLGAGLPSRYGRIQKMHTDGIAGLIEFDRKLSRCRRVVHQSGTLRHRGQNTFRVGRDCPDIAIIAHAEKHDAGVNSGLGRGRC